MNLAPNIESVVEPDLTVPCDMTTHTGDAPASMLIRLRCPWCGRGGRVEAVCTPCWRSAGWMRCPVARGGCGFHGWRTTFWRVVYRLSL